MGSRCRRGLAPAWLSRCGSDSSAAGGSRRPGTSPRSNGRRRGTSLTKTKTNDKLDAKDAKSATRPGTRGKSARPGDKKPTKSKSGDRPNIFGRFVNFVREVVAELRKVIWPTRKELLTYTAVVVLFVALMITIVAGLDWVFAKGVLWVFGDGGSAAE